MACSAASIASIVSSNSRLNHKPHVSLKKCISSNTISFGSSFSCRFPPSDFKNVVSSSRRRILVVRASELPLVTAPDFEAVSVFDQEFIKVKLSDFFSDRSEEFQNWNTEVLGVSIDSVVSQFSHLAWVQTDRKSGGLDTKRLSGSRSDETERAKRMLVFVPTTLCWLHASLAPFQVARATELRTNVLYDVGELFELGIQLSYLLLLLALLGVGSFFVIRQVLVRRELDLSAKELQEQVRSGDASATELFELGAVMLRRKLYPAATKYLLETIEKWDGEDQDLAQVHNALGVTYVRDGKVEKGIAQFESAVKLQPGYVTAWNNLGDAYEKTNDLKLALRAFQEVVLLDPNNKVARPRRDALQEKVDMYKGVPVRSKKK